MDKPAHGYDIGPVYYDEAGELTLTGRLPDQPRRKLDFDAVYIDEIGQAWIILAATRTSHCSFLHGVRRTTGATLSDRAGP